MDSGYSRSREELILSFEPLVKATAGRTYRKLSWMITSYEDLYQTVWYLVLYAFETYDPARGKLAPHVKATVDRKLHSMLNGEKAPRSSGYPFTFLRQKEVLLEEARG